ncbi:MAG: hypothetical protein EHM81_02185 [Chloroflexi bacterium]|nr:MAG: hypothetical protein EHM81_02185 [Chloroflexota bacterium]
MRYLLGIDDTDNLESRGTGHRVRQMADFLGQGGLARPLGITRHQLLVSPEIPYTSHNSSACLVVESTLPSTDALWEAACDFLLRESAPGSDAGLCLAAWGAVGVSVLAFGTRAKQVVLTQAEAAETARNQDLRLIGLTGTHGGIIGALAGVGLHVGGNDGRYLWLPGLRELQGKYTVADLCARVPIERVCDADGQDLSPTALVDVGEWLRPIRRAGQATLIVEESENDWHIISKDRIKKLSD